MAPLQWRSCIGAVDGANATAPLEWRHWENPQGTTGDPRGHQGTTVDGINLATPRAPRGPKFYKFRFFVVLRVPGGPGAITNRRGMKKHARGLIFVNFGWIYEWPIFDFLMNCSDTHIPRVLNHFP